MSAKVLVANRSEIACRIFQACRELGLQTVAVVAPGDEQARHVTYADEVVSISSYLNPGEIVQAAQKVGAGLIHPGYGFLSERPAFARAVEEAGLTFIGPKAETMALMGDKIAAKALAGQHQVPTLPWAQISPGVSVSNRVTSEVPQSGLSDLRKAAQTVGYPLLLKAAAGGGGKGMRRVFHPEELEAAAESASAEALAAFGEGTLFLERWIERPRHIEVQVFGDGHGGGVHLFERECSLQRRHQKIWEEAPAQNLKPSTLDALYEAAMRLVKATQYRSAGTLEFLVETSSDGQESFYFLEMNTRLQVEHPVTEQITGLDLVRAQLLFALHPDSFPLPSQPQIQKRGHAIEVRLYAEDPAQGFQPTPGTVECLRWPLGAGIRIESGIEEGQTVGIQFDSLLAKVIVTAEGRTAALQRLRAALAETVLLGLGSNLTYLQALAEHPAVWEAKIYTGFLEKSWGPFVPPQPTQQELELLASIHHHRLGDEPRQAQSQAHANAAHTGAPASGHQLPGTVLNPSLFHRSPWFTDAKADAKGRGVL